MVFHKKNTLLIFFKIKIKILKLNLFILIK
jgi:hypothetical protein